MSKEILSPRPIFREPIDEEKSTSKSKHLLIGTKDSGISLRFTAEGVEVNGYYKGYHTDSPLFANIREPIEMSWGEVDRLKEEILNPPKKKRKRQSSKTKPDKIDTPDEEYLKSLPIVTINKKKYYIDGEKHERRPVNNPKQVFNYKSIGVK